MYLVLSAFTSSPVSLRAASKATVFFFMVWPLENSMLEKNGKYQLD